MNDEEIRAVVRAAIAEFSNGEQARLEESSRTELAEERQKSEGLRKQVDDLIKETAQFKSKAEEAERHGSIRTELQRIGVRNVDLAYRAVRDEVLRAADGSLQGAGGEPLGEFLAKFARENPELLPARLSGGSGASPSQPPSGTNRALDLDRIRPGMNPEEMDRIRQEIARVALQTMRGL